MSSIFFHFHLTNKNMEKLSPNRAQFFVRNKYTIFTMGGTVALRSVNKIFFRRATVLQLTSNLFIWITVKVLPVKHYIIG